MSGYRKILLSILSFFCICHGFDLLPMPCKVSLTNSCPALLYYVPKELKSAEETAALFRVDSNAVNKTHNGFLIVVTCSCPADHEEYVWHMGYTIQTGDTWKLISEKFGLLVAERPEKQLFPSTNVSLDVLCGCLEGVKMVTYTIKPGDTLFTICSLFGVDIDQITKLNRIADASIILAGDKIFIPATGLDHLIVLDKNDSNSKGSSRSQRRIVLGIVVPAVTIMLVSATLLFWIYYKRKRKKRSKAFPGGTRNLKVSGTFPFCDCKMGFFLESHSSYKGNTTPFKSAKTTIFSYDEVCLATTKFSASHKIGQGSYGCVYRGRLREVDVAIKQMKNTKSKEFFAELNILCKAYHSNLIKLLGYSAGAESLFLVYEFAQNGALGEHLHNPSVKGHKPLTWSTRVKIALDAAKGLEYIHVHIKPFCVHRDVKTSNILLDSNFHAKIADFGLVKLLEQSPEVGVTTSKLVGTFGYLAPEYVRDGRVTPKGDVYAYGVVLMELITGQPALSRIKGVENTQYVEHQSLVDFMLCTLEESDDPMLQLEKCVDSNLIHYHKDSLLQMALLSKDCVDDDWIRRPDMSQVVLRLSHIVGSMDQRIAAMEREEETDRAEYSSAFQQPKGDGVYR